MNPYQVAMSIPCEVKHIDTENVAITFVLPAAHINSFVLMLQSMAELFRGLGWKAKTNRDGIHLRTKENEAQIKDRNERYYKFVCDTFTDQLAKSKNAREALSLTVSLAIIDYPFSSYDIVKNCLSKNKLLKNTGYYKSRHKFD